MHTNHLKLLVCPETKGNLQLLEEKYDSKGEIVSGQLYSATTGKSYPIIDYIPRFVPSDNYAKSFGFEWNKHSTTQHDSHSNIDMSKKRFNQETQWEKDLNGKLMLEAGCGAGRFTPHAAETNATLVSFDYSNAVDASRRINSHYKNVLFLQADIYQMPFPKNSFDYIYCLGVLQHTPFPQKAFNCLVEMLNEGGRIASDIYIKDFLHWFIQTKYYVRPISRRLPPALLYRLVRLYINFMWPLVRLIRQIPYRIGQGICWRLLVADQYSQVPGMPDKELKEWAYLDTFDMLSPKYDYPQTIKAFKKWHEEANLIDIEVHKGHNGIEGRGKRKQAID